MYASKNILRRNRHKGGRGGKKREREKKIEKEKKAFFSLQSKALKSSAPTPPPPTGLCSDRGPWQPGDRNEGSDSATLPLFPFPSNGDRDGDWGRDRDRQIKQEGRTLRQFSAEAAAELVICWSVSEPQTPTAFSLWGTLRRDGPATHLGRGHRVGTPCTPPPWWPSAAGLLLPPLSPQLRAVSSPRRPGQGAGVPGGESITHAATLLHPSSLPPKATVVPSHDTLYSGRRTSALRTRKKERGPADPLRHAQRVRGVTSPSWHSPGPAKAPVLRSFLTGARLPHFFSISSSSPGTVHLINTTALPAVPISLAWHTPSPFLTLTPPYSPHTLTLCHSDSHPPLCSSSHILISHSLVHTHTLTHTSPLLTHSHLLSLIVTHSPSFPFTLPHTHLRPRSLSLPNLSPFPQNHGPFVGEELKAAYSNLSRYVQLC